jgi:hypothetical protein
MEQKQIQEALARINGILETARFTDPLLNRREHALLAQDLQLVQQCCAEGLEAVKELDIMSKEKLPAEG